MAQTINVDVNVKSQAAIGAFAGMAASITSAGLALVSAGIEAAIDAIGESISLASDKAEAANKVNVLFADSADQITEASKTAATTVGLSSGAYLTAAGNLGNLLANFDLSTQAAADMSQGMINLAADVGSFNNADPSEVVEAMGAAMRGESEPMRRFGVLIDEAGIKAYGMAHGLDTSKEAVDKSGRAQAIYQLMLEQTTQAQGDFAETSDGMANSQRINAARMEDSMTRIGEALMPLVQQIMPVLADVAVAVADAIGDLVEAAVDWIHDNQDFIDSVVDLGRVLWDLYTKYIGTLIEVIGELGYRVGGIIGLFVDLAKSIVDFGGAMVKVLSGDFQGAADQASMAMDEITSFGENVLRATGDAGQKMRDTASAALAETAEAADAAASDSINALAGGYAAGAPEVAAAAADVASSIPEEVAAASEEAVQIAAKTPFELADGIRSARDAPRSAMDDLRESLKQSISPAKEMAQLEGLLSSKALARGLHSGDPEVQLRAQGTLDVITGRLDELKGKATVAGQVGAGAVGTGLSSKDPAVRAAATATTSIVSTQFDLMENGARVSAQTANITLAVTLQAGANAARQAGSNVGSAWGAGVAAGVRASQAEIARAAAQATGPIRGYSPPKEGPLMHIDEWGESIGRAWKSGVAKGAGYGDLLAGTLNVGGSSGAAAGAGVTVNVYAGVGDPVAIGREVDATLKAFYRASGTQT